MKNKKHFCEKCHKFVNGTSRIEVRNTFAFAAGEKGEKRKVPISVPKENFYCPICNNELYDSKAWDQYLKDKEIETKKIDGALWCSN